MAVNLTPDTLAAIMPECRQPARWAHSLDTAMRAYSINTLDRAAHFLGTVAHESRGLSVLQESLDYSAVRLCQVWPTRFWLPNPGTQCPPGRRDARDYARNPARLAEAVYGGRMGNTQPGDGWRYRGRCPIQITGREMYRAAGAALGIDLEHNCALALECEHGAMIAAWVFAQEKTCLPLADANDYEGVRRRINGGSVGLADAIKRTDRALAVLTFMDIEETT